jgi:hypothetical protein
MPIERRKQEDGESKCCSVMEQIRASALRESGPTSIWSFITRKFGKPRKEAKQMTANMPAQTGMDAGAVSHEKVDWDSIDWNAAHQNVCRLQFKNTFVRAYRWSSSLQEIAL